MAFFIENLSNDRKKMTGYKLINNGNDHRYEFQIDGFVPKIKYLLSKNGEFKKDRILSYRDGILSWKIDTA